jgi:GT2 family glycosyltransferase
MDLSIIIVNYNVKYFLEQCLCSVQKACRSLQAEIIVVDNNSRDGSVDYLRKKFPNVYFISNHQNLGFAKANNEALKRAIGKAVLFLNPDTILAEDSLEKSFQFLFNKEQVGAVGIRMIDGAGIFLKESKRGFPSIWNSFCKMAGLANAFPRTGFFSGYYLGQLSDQQNHEIDALSGAFLMVKKEVIDKIGGFDERFFMYAEDIDLSYRIQQAGYKNYYFSESTILHFKGESTNKTSSNIRLFYKAMSMFVQKHYSRPSYRLLVPVLNAAIWFKQGISIITQGWNKAKKPDTTTFSLSCSAQGDPESIEELRRFFDISDRTETTIFCEGRAFTFKQIIAEVENLSKSRNFLIHGYGSASVVGSSISKRMGIAIPLEKHSVQHA